MYYHLYFAFQMCKKSLSNRINIHNNDWACDHISACVGKEKHLLAFMYIIVLLFVLTVDVTFFPHKKKSK